MSLSNHSPFHSYLLTKFDGDAQEVNAVLEAAEQIVPGVLNEYFGAGISSIYDLTDTTEIEEYRKKIKAHPILKGIDNASEPRYTEVLKWYRLFVKASNAKPSPYPVQGEEDGAHGVLKDIDSESKANKEQPPVELQTIFMEGEEGETLTVEQRRRNRELREACIKHFKAQHGGRIVCECCGFDFSKAYDTADEYIEVHHRFPFAHTEGEHPVNSATDLVPLCANCHRMIHHGQGGKGNCMSLDELKSKYKGIQYK